MATTKNHIQKGGSLVRYQMAAFKRTLAKGMPKGSKVGKYRAQRSDAGKKRK